MHWQRNSKFFLFAIVSAFVCAGSVLVVGPASADESIDPCPPNEIAFTPIDPKYSPWWTFWTGRHPTSKLLRYGEPVAEIRLRYDDSPVVMTGWHEDMKTIEIGRHFFAYSLNPQSESLTWISLLPASGYIAYRTADGSTVAKFTMNASTYESVEVEIDYGGVRVPKERVFTDIYCFVMSATVREGLQ